MTKCKFCNECKKPPTIMGPICGYCKRYKKTTGYYGNSMQVLQRMFCSVPYFFFNVLMHIFLNEVGCDNFYCPCISRNFRFIYHRYLTC